jgi:DNA-binding NtrC family response regulator
VIDDDVDIRVLLWDRLEAMGFEVVTESNGHAGLSRIEREARLGSIDGVLLELFLPVLDGIGVLEELQMRHPEIPVIVMSAAIHSGEFQAAIKSGASDCIAKPFAVEVLANKCEKIFLKKP